VGDLGQLAGLIHHLMDGAQGLLFVEPGLKATGSPLGEVGGVDGLGGKLLRHNGLGLGEAVEPLEQLWSLLTVAEPTIQLFPGLEGEPGYFACSCHRFDVWFGVRFPERGCVAGSQSSVTLLQGNIFTLNYFYLLLFTFNCL